MRHRTTRGLAGTALLLFSVACHGAASPAAPSPEIPAATLASLTITPSAVAGGASVSATVTLSSSALAGGTTVTLTASAPSVMVPASVTVAAGSTSAAFSIGTSAVSASADVTITATAGDASRTAVLRVNAAEAPAPLVGLTPANDDLIGGENSTATIELQAAAPSGGIRIALASDDDALEVPASLTIEAGRRSGSFEMRTRPVSAARDVRVTATYTPSTVQAGSVTLTMTLRLLPQPLENLPPSAIADSYDADEDTPLVVTAAGVLANDSDPNGDTLTATLASMPANGTVALNGNGSFTYTPSANFFGDDSFTYVASDGSASSNPVTVSIAVAQRFDDERVFEYNGTDGTDGSSQAFAVPIGITTIEIEAFGAEGGGQAGGQVGGLGARVLATVDVSAGEELSVLVGGTPGSAMNGGFNGGGAAGSASYRGYAGGGASDVRRGGFSLAERLVVAAGGGGSGAVSLGPGGDSGEDGGASTGIGGAAAVGATPGAGGSPDGESGGSPTLDAGGAGGSSTDMFQYGGGGGGGGLAGGGGGGSSDGGGVPSGGGGGSSGTAGGATIVLIENGVRDGNGRVIIRW